MRSKTLTQVVQELDHNLFDSYVKPKAVAITSIVRRGVLDPEMDWYDSPRPSGTFVPFIYPPDYAIYSSLTHENSPFVLCVSSRNSTIHVRDPYVPGPGARTCCDRVEVTSGTHS